MEAALRAETLSKKIEDAVHEESATHSAFAAAPRRCPDAPPHRPLSVAPNYSVGDGG
jgi:hypothetical protein